MNIGERPFVDKKSYDRLSRGNFKRIGEEIAASEGACMIAVAQKPHGTISAQPIEQPVVEANQPK